LTRLQRAHEAGKPVRAVGIRATASGVIVDAGGVEGYIRRRELPWGYKSEPIRCVGLELEGLVVSKPWRGEGLLISPAALAYARCSDAQASGRRIRGTVVRANNGGLIIEVMGMRSFLPRSRMKRRQERRYRSLEGRRWKGYALRVTQQQMIVSSTRPTVSRRP
jgi:ribosomal protein S1